MAIVFVVLGAAIVIWIALYIVHCIMVISDPNTKDYAFGTWKDFINCYNKKEWHNVCKSLFSDDDTSYIGDSTIYFNHQGMILDPVSFLIYGLWTAKRLANHKKHRFTIHANWRNI